jgi:hypothetical protein
MPTDLPVGFSCLMKFELHETLALLGNISDLMFIGPLLFNSLVSSPDNVMSLRDNDTYTSMFLIVSEVRHLIIIRTCLFRALSKPKEKHTF